MPSLAIAFVVRLLLVALFLPFSALDKILNFSAAVDQAAGVAPARPLATALILAGFCIEVFMSLAVLTGIADRLAAVVLAAYCVATAILWKRFWATSDFRLRGASRGRDLFWDFLKNLSVAGGFLLLALGPSGAGVGQMLADPFSSTQPYASGPLPADLAKAEAP